MATHIEILGDEEQVLYKHLNKQYSTQKRLVITKDVILHSFEGNDLSTLFHELMNSPPDSYTAILNKAKEQEIFNGILKNDLYKNIQDRLSKVSENLDIQLKDYNFMNSISNARFTVTLRCDQFSTRLYFQEKGALMSSIRTLLQKYLEFPGNVYRLGRLDKFQIEIAEAEEVYKHICMKKEDNKLVLYAGFGFLKNEDTDYSSGGEYYFSIGEDFNFYKNKQQFALVKEGSSIVEKEIHEQEKVLSNNELMTINEQTKHLSDVYIEGYLNKKGVFKISHVALVETIPSFHSENGFVMHKSSKNYDKIGLITLKDHISEDTTNPNYLVIKNNNELKELLTSFSVFKNVDGIIFTYNSFSTLIEHIADYLDLDIIYYDQRLSKTLETTITWSPLSIEVPEGQQSQGMNPFSSILQEERKEKDELLERLKNVDLNTPERTPRSIEETQKVQQIAEGLVSSPGASTAKQNPMGWSSSTPSLSGQGGKKTAMQMLADVALNKPEEKPEPVQEAPAPQVVEQTTQEVDFATHMQQSDLVMNNVQAEDLKPLTQETLDQTSEQIKQVTENIQPSNNLVSKYEDVLATKILTPPTVSSPAYLTDVNNISQIQDNGKIYFVTTKIDENANSSIKYVIPITIEDQVDKADYLLINSLEDFFLINERKRHDKKFFINLSHIPKEMRKKALNEGLNKLNKVSLIILKEDLDLLEDNIDKINEVYIKDLTSQEELSSAKHDILGLEKRHIMRK